MALRLVSAQDYEGYFQKVANADWKTHYFSSSGQVQERCVFSSLWKRILSLLPCLRNTLVPKFESSLALFRDRIEAYDRINIAERREGFQSDIIAAAEKLNALRKHINGKRKQRGEAKIDKSQKIQIEALRARWIGAGRKKGVSESVYLSASIVQDVRNEQRPPPSLLSSQLVPPKK